MLIIEEKLRLEFLDDPPVIEVQRRKKIGLSLHKATWKDGIPAKIFFFWC